MNQSVSCAFFIIGFAAFTIYLILLLVYNARLPKERRSSMANSYPYQYYREQPVGYRIILYVLLGLAALGLGFGESAYLYSFNTTYLGILGVLFPLSLIALVGSNFLSLSHYRLHLLFSCMGFFSFLAACLLLSFTSVIPGGLDIASHVNLIIYVLIGIIGGICFLAMFNPKLMDWAKMNRAEENGKVFYVKPKVNFYAFYEWIYLFLMVVVAFLMFLDLVITQIPA